MDDVITTLQKLHEVLKPEIAGRIKEFKKNNTREKIEKEFFFCLLTPQCKARVCWDNIEKLYPCGVLHEGSAGDISGSFRGVRFKNNKAKYIVEAREKFFSGNAPFLEFLSRNKDVFALREYIVGNVKGMGYKEASHFLRNIGKGEELAILDRHILRGLKMAGVIEEIPGSLPRKTYAWIENGMREFSSEKVKIPMMHLDFVFWNFFKGEVFK